MATTKIIKVKINPKATITYITNPEKTDGKSLVSYEGCTEENAAVMFELALRGKRKQRKDSVLAYHFIQSFSPEDNLTPEKAHEIGGQLMEQLFHGKYSFVCATHEDKKHLHNHFVVCAAERGMTGKKINDDLALLHKIQRINDNLCRENGLSVVDKKRGRGKKHNECQMEQENPGSSQKAKLRNMIDEAVAVSANFNDFIECLKKQNIEISYGNSKKYGKVTKYKLPDAERCHRGYKLGSAYSDSAIRKRIEIRLQAQTSKAYRAEQKKISKAAMTTAEKIQDRGSLKIRHIMDSSLDEAYGLTKWKHTQNSRLSQSVEQKILDKYGLQYTEIAGKISSLKAENNLLSSKLAEQNKSCNNLRSLIDSCRIYTETKRFKEHLAKAKKPHQYAQEHADQLSAFASASSALELNRVPKQLVNSDYINELQKFLQTYENEAVKIEKQKTQNNKMLQELTKVQREINAYLGQAQPDRDNQHSK